MASVEKYVVCVCHLLCVCVCRSSENLVSIEESDRHCVAGGMGLQVLTSSTSSLSSGGWENGEDGEEEFTASVQPQAGEGMKEAE